MTGGVPLLSGRKYRLELDTNQAELCEIFGGLCRSVWNTALEQRREYRRRGAWMNPAACATAAPTSAHRRPARWPPATPSWCSRTSVSAT
ncbi:helix-turn-helix domain-containing protein [Kitasatospora sp. NPDC004745]|uniref:helix-turn-helix domain-containing protein n=1 Tax=Kitasatospora sp. NPDC004745 TaxID=3364019 RepID=UPI003694A778